MEVHDAIPIAAVDDEPTGVVALPAAPATPSQAIATTARLVCLVGGQVGQVFVLGVRPATIGRAPDAQIVIAGSEVSRHHACVTWSEGRFILEDLSSRNGTRVNGVPVSRHTLAVGDRIHLGASAILVFTQHDDLELRAQRLQKLEAMSQVAGEVAHDFKNVLMVVLGNAELLGETARERYPDDQELHHGLAAIESVAAGAAQLANRLLDFARREPPAEPTQVAIAQVVDDIATMVRGSFGDAIRIDLKIEPGLEVRGNRGELHHVLLNLCLNARDAMPGGGRLTIRTRAVTIDREESLNMHLPARGRYMELIVADTGTGMDEATLARVFEPFFTTKAAAGKGTGLGLSAVYGVVRAHGGNIMVESTLGAGTLFRIYLPASASPDGARGEDTGTLLVLVIEPSREVCDAHGDNLRALGYTPIHASNAMRALDLFRDQLHRLVAVMVPREMTGVLDELRKLDPLGRVVVVLARAGTTYQLDELRTALIAAHLPVAGSPDP